MSWLESLIFGFISGLTEFLPISAPAHQSMMLRLFGAENGIGLIQLMIHIAILLALFTCCSEDFGGLYREIRLKKMSRRRRKRKSDARKTLDIALVRSAFFPMAIGFIFYPMASSYQNKLNFMALFMLLNGILLYIPLHMRSGNKDSRAMSRLDGTLIGFGAALAVLPGISRIAAASTVATARGADRQHALRWALYITVPAILILMGFDFRDIVVQGAGIHSFGGFIQAIFTAGAAYCGAYAAILVMRFMAVNAGFSSFSYYCWGAALYAFILFLTI